MILTGGTICMVQTENGLILFFIFTHGNIIFFQKRINGEAQLFGRIHQS